MGQVYGPTGAGNGEGAQPILRPSSLPAAGTLLRTWTALRTVYVRNAVQVQLEMNDTPTSLAGRERTIRAGLVVLAATQVGVALWALFAPLSFHTDFPGFGRQWVSPLGPFNEHFVTDVGATFLALTVLLVLAAVWLQRRLVQAALIAWLVYSVPHLIWHLGNLEPFGATDVALNVGALALQVVLPLALLAMTLGRVPAGSRTTTSEVTS
jgi:hypothetical protein